jgi:superoxide dismutase
MKLHHSKHHAADVNNLSVAEEKLKEAQAKSKRDFINLVF